MTRCGSRVLLRGCCPAVCYVLVASVALAERPIDYSRDIRPIFSDNCYQCHGPDEARRRTEWRLDIKEIALGELDSGEMGIVPGKVAESELYRRITAENVYERMPARNSGKRLSAGQIELIRRWIDEGAPWREHWAFIKPQRPAPPQPAGDDWARNPIDRFVLARLEEEGLKHSPEADKTTLIRRATLDLTGLPPTPDEIDAFLGDESSDAYEKLVDRLLASPHYGEHMARYWLDLARYGDTHGLHLDNERSLWPYRDWVIAAFNENVPFDQFTVEQLAGDLLPEPTLQQRVATGFNRCNVTTSEGGSIDEEYIVRYAVDRTETMGTTWLGLTVGCAVCHDHKFDPISQKEFYQLYAFFNNTADRAMDGNALLPPPILKLPTPEQTEQKLAYARRIDELQRQIQTELAKIEYKEPEPESKPEPAEPETYVWIDDALPPGAQPATDGSSGWQFVAGPDNPVQSGEKSSTRTAEGLAQHFFTGASPGLTVGEAAVLFAYVYLDPDNPPKQIMLQFNDGSWEHRATWGEDRIPWGTKDTPSRLPIGPLPEPGGWARLEVEAANVGLEPGAVINGWAFTQFGGTVYWDTAGIVGQSLQDGDRFVSLLAWEESQRAAKKPALPKPVLEAIKVDREKRTPEQQKLVRDHFLEHIYPDTRSVFDPLHEQLETAKKELDALEESIPASMVTEERPQLREAFVLKRGQYDQPQQKVDRDVPAVLPPLPTGAPRNRLGLARWLVDPSHPLTARVTVNRFWQQHFGVGLVKTSEDFGSQGEWPSHPKLLDWLATEFITSGWDVKHLQKLILTSATYRQSSRVSAKLLARDPENRLVARGARFRLDAETVRDNALAISGLLVEKIGGPSVKPYQPPGIWRAVGYSSSNTSKFKQDTGDALFRRSLYTFWKRTSPPPTMLLLDAPSRENCIARRARTNTPLAALALMNDVQFVEAARHLGRRMMTEGGEEPRERIIYGFRLATAREPDDEELEILLKQYKAHLAEFKQNKEAASKLIRFGDSKPDESLEPSELAAWTMVANLLLNLDETVTKG